MERAYTFTEIESLENAAKTLFILRGQAYFPQEKIVFIHEQVRTWMAGNVEVSDVVENVKSKKAEAQAKRPESFTVGNHRPQTGKTLTVSEPLTPFHSVCPDHIAKVQSGWRIGDK
jgi:hypothetical protein